jgi:hypothetical protein
MTDDKRKSVVRCRTKRQPGDLSFVICHLSFLDGRRRLEHFFLVEPGVFANRSEPPAYAEF